jgi:hypothetical protein
MATPINALKTQCDNGTGPLYEKGWDFCPVDTNTGAGGKYIYIGYQLGDAHPVTSLNFVAYDKKQENPPAGWNWSPQDLNQDAGGKYIYMVWKNGEPGKQPILSFMLMVVNDSHQPQIPGYTAIHQDLNEGAGGPYIWPYVSTTIGFDGKTDKMLKAA